MPGIILAQNCQCRFAALVIGVIQDSTRRAGSADVIERVVEGAFFWPALMLFKIGLQLCFGFFGVGYKFPPRAKCQLANIAVSSTGSAPDESDNSEPSVGHGDMMAGRSGPVKCALTPRPELILAVRTSPLRRPGRLLLTKLREGADVVPVISIDGLRKSSFLTVCNSM